jgi:hypothetical protein
MIFFEISPANNPSRTTSYQNCLVGVVEGVKEVGGAVPPGSESKAAASTNVPSGVPPKRKDV